MKSLRFDAVEGIRGFLALWVVLGHVFQLSGVSEVIFPLNILLRADYAVDIFIILSGFVITHLIVDKGEPYVTFITRRFFRLFPAYFVCCVAGFLLTRAYLDYIALAPVPSSDFWTQFQAERIARNQYMHSSFLSHVLAHLTMLHGAVPNAWLPSSAVMFLAPAWSISLEWQFYLLAPAILWLLRSGGRIGAAVVIVGAVVAYGIYTKGWLGDFTYKAFLPAAVGYFAIGIVSRLLIGRLKPMGIDPFVVSLALCAFSYWFSKDLVVFVIWSVFFSYLTFGADRIDGAAFKFVFNNAISQFIGRISYSIYLVHIPVIVVVGYISVKIFSIGEQVALLTVNMIGSVTLTILISYILHYAVEKPGIRFGGWLTSRRSGRG